MNKGSESSAVAASAVIEEDEMRDEYDFSQMTGCVRGKDAVRYRQGTNLVLLAPDVTKAFPSSEAVNDALRKLMQKEAK